jgi:group I intron endonuclease
MSGIYMIHNSENHYLYIGSAVILRKRKSTHDHRLRKGNHHSIKLQRFVNKYGIDKLIFSPIIFCDKSELQEKEQVLLNIFKPFYNIATDASNALLGRPFTDEMRAKISAIHKGRVLSDNHKELIRLSSLGRPSPTKGKPAHNRGVKHTAESSRKMSLSRVGKKQSELTKLKRSLLFNGGGNPKAKIVVDMSTGIFFDCGKEAANAYGINPGTLKCWLNGRRKNPTNLIYA